VLWHYRLVAMTQRVGSLLPFVQRVPVAGAGLESLLLFARQLPLCAWPDHQGEGKVVGVQHS
jgi:hypothetical protein